MHVCALAFSEKTWLLYIFFFLCVRIFFCISSLQLDGEAYHIETAVKLCLNRFEIKAWDLCCLINSRLRKTFLIVCVLAYRSFSGKPDRLEYLNSGKKLIPYAFNKE